jgi:two-component system sensor kinase FixL
MSTPGSNAELQALLDAAVDGVIIIDHLGRVQTFNKSAERLFGYQTLELLGRNVSMLMTEADRSSHDAHLVQYLKSGVPHIIGKGREVTALRKDGTVFPAFLSVGAIQDLGPPRFVGFIQDISVRRQAQEQMRRLQERLWHVSRLATVGEMASGIAHELNQPLAAIANYAQACDRLLTRPDADLEEIHGALNAIASEAVRAGDTIRKLRSLARDESERPELTDINTLIGELMELVHSQARAQNVRVRLELGKNLPALTVQRAQIQQVILNLARNAIESVSGSERSQREISVRTSQGHDGELEIAICDNGPGVLQSIVPRLFEPFCTSKASGTGLGLAISRTIVAQHRGRVSYQPNSPAGACFVVRLPLNREN